jgi:sec-independent protein translocase protein TatA
MPELIIILVVALLIFGPKKLPEMGKAIGASIKEFRKGMNEITQPKDKEEDEETPKLTTTMTDPILRENMSRLNSSDLPKAYAEPEKVNSMEEVKRD